MMHAVLLALQSDGLMAPATCTLTCNVGGNAGAGEDRNASQFYITLGKDLDSLDEKHTIFGEVGAHTDQDGLRVSGQPSLLQVPLSQPYVPPLA